MTAEEHAENCIVVGDDYYNTLDGGETHKRIVAAICAAVAEEREACAKLADEFAVWKEHGISTGEAIAAAIRQRGHQ